MEVLQDFPVRLQHAGLMIGDGSLPTERLDDFLRLSLVVPRHGREQMMLDLATEGTEQEVGKGVSFEISRGEDLPA